MQNLKRKPAYFDTLQHYPNANPIFIAVDQLSLKIIHRFKGTCLLCDQAADCYDLAFCRQREVWVLYSSLEIFSGALKLARVLQLDGAAEVFLILIDVRLAQETNNDKK